MLRNNLYNLMLQTVQESKSLSRIKDEYMKDAVGMDDIMGIWKKLEKDKADHVAELTKLVAKYSGQLGTENK
jgi:hypothetical protein